MRTTLYRNVTFASLMLATLTLAGTKLWNSYGPTSWRPRKHRAPKGRHHYGMRMDFTCTPVSDFLSRYQPDNNRAYQGRHHVAV